MKKINRLKHMSMRNNGFRKVVGNMMELKFGDNLRELREKTDTPESSWPKKYPIRKNPSRSGS